MPAYNRQYTISRAIESVQQQTYSSWELIIVDDCSSDETQRIIQSYLKKDVRIQCIKNEVNMGVSGARNIGIRKALGEYIAFLDSDDEWMKEHLEECIQLLNEEGYDICSALWLEEDHGVIRDVRNYPWFMDSLEHAAKELSFNQNDRVWRFHNDFYEYILISGFYCYHINTILMRREIFDTVGYFNETFNTSEDLEFLYRVFEQYPLITINKSHFIYHFGQNNLYAYVNRETITKRILMENQELVKKQTYNLSVKIKMYSQLLKRIRKSNQMTNKQKVIHSIKTSAFNRCMTIVLMNQKYNKWLAFKYLFITMGFITTISCFLYIVFYNREKYIDLYFCFD